MSAQTDRQTCNCVSCRCNPCTCGSTAAKRTERNDCGSQCGCSTPATQPANTR